MQSEDSGTEPQEARPLCLELVPGSRQGNKANVFAAFSWVPLCPESEPKSRRDDERQQLNPGESVMVEVIEEQELEQRINERVDKKIAALRAKLDRSEQNLTKQIRFFDPTQTTKFLNDIKDDNQYLHKRLQMMILRVCVSTEVCRHFSDADVIKRMIMAFDNDDSWWQGRETWTIKQWVNFFEGGENVSL